MTNFYPQLKNRWKAHFFNKYFCYFWNVLKKGFIPYIYIAFFLFNAGSIIGQKLVLKIAPKDSLNTIFVHSIKYQKIHHTEITLFQSIDSVKNQIALNGFINSTLDTIVKIDSIYNVQFSLGNLSNNVKIFYDEKNISAAQLKKINLSATDQYFIVETKKLSRRLDQIVGLFENQGNAFAQVSLKDIGIHRDTIEAFLHIKESNPRKIDKVIINGYPDFPTSYLKHYFKLSNNTIFSRKKLDRISANIKNLSFVKEIKPPEVLFTADSTMVYLYLKKKESNKFDGLIGFTSKENGNGIQFNGYLDLSLNNVFHSGESIAFYWKNNGDERQVFNLNTSLPYIFNSKLSPKAELNMYKQDSSFINTNLRFYLPYSLNERNNIGISFQSLSSSDLLTNNTGTDILAFNNIFYGLNYNYQIPNPNNLFSSKFNLYSEILRGNRKIEDHSTTQSKLYVRTNYLWSLNYRNHIFIQNESSTLLSNDKLLNNELFRIGGSNSMRGFNEESILASSFSYFNLEYRVLTDNTSYIYTITDAGYIDNNIIDKDSKIYAIGVGYAFSIKFGFLDLSYALGGIANEPFNLDNSRFHLKIISFF